MKDLERLKDGVEGAKLKSLKWQPVFVVIYSSHCTLKSLETIYQH